MSPSKQRSRRRDCGWRRRPGRWRSHETTSMFQVIAPGPLFGLGEQFTKSELRNFRTSLHPENTQWTPGHKWDYMSIPYVYSPNGTGVYFDTAFDCVFDSTQAGQPGF